MIQQMPLIAVLLTATAAFAGDKTVDYRKVDRDLQARNAARLDNGGCIRLELLGDKVFKDRRTEPDQVVDGNVHSRQVMTGGPYRFHIDLIDELPIEAIHLICSDYAGEVSLKDVEVKLSDGTVFKKTMERLPAKRRAAKPRETIDIGDQQARWIEVTVLTSYPGGMSESNRQIGWGGLGEIEVITTADLTEYTRLIDYNADLVQDIRSDPPRADYSKVTVTLPTPIPLGQRPGIYMSDAEWQVLFRTMRATERGKPVLDGYVVPYRTDGQPRDRHRPARRQHAGVRW